MCEFDDVPAGYFARPAHTGRSCQFRPDGTEVRLAKAVPVVVPLTGHFTGRVLRPTLPSAPAVACGVPVEETTQVGLVAPRRRRARRPDRSPPIGQVDHRCFT